MGKHVSNKNYHDFKNPKCEQTIGKGGALARHVLGTNRFMPARSPPSLTPKNKNPTWYRPSHHNVSKLLGREGPLLGTYLVPTVSCRLEAPPPPPQKKTTWWRPSHHPQNHPIRYPIPTLRSRYRTHDGALLCSPHSPLSVWQIHCCHVL